MEVLETRELLEDCPSNMLMQLQRENREKIQDVTQSLNQAFLLKDIQTAKKLTIRLSYLFKIQEEIIRQVPVQ